jgi:predicted dinucleotide-binding enzyme
LAKFWEAAAHEVSAFGRDGGEASSADVVVVALPSDSIKDAFAKVTGFEGKPAIDATNAYVGRDESFPSLAHEVKSITGGPVAKAFNLNFSATYGEIAAQRLPPSQLWCGDEEARDVTERLIRDVGYEPVAAGGLENARVLEDFVMALAATWETFGGPAVYRFARPGEL